MGLSEIRKHYISEGYSALNASAKTCQDVILAKIAASPLKKSVTVKGGVLMCAISSSKRQATQDIDLDFVRYPISDEAIRSFIRTLSAVDDGISMDIVGGIPREKGCGCSICLLNADSKRRQISTPSENINTAFSAFPAFELHKRNHDHPHSGWFALRV